MKRYIKHSLVEAWMAAVGGKGDFRNLKHETALIIKDQIPREVCYELRDRIDRLADSADDGRVWRDKAASDTRVLAFENVMSDHLHYLQIPDKIRAIDAYLGTKTRSWFLMANRLTPKPGNLGSGGGLHRDSPYSHQVKCIWYLSDVSSENGPFQYVPGSHSSAFLDRKKYPLGQSRFASAHDPLVEVLAPAGTLLVADTKCIHAGKPIEAGARYALTLYTYKSIEKSKQSFREQNVSPSYVQSCAPR